MTEIVQTDLENIAIVLCRPKYGGNVGSVARVAKNMGVKRVIVVEGQELDQEEMKRMATHFATAEIDNISYFPDLAQALADFQWVVGTTSKLGKTRRPAVYPRQAAREIANISQRNQVALLFGSEDNGLTNEDLRYCHSVVTIPTSERFKSINLSHAVMILCYELFIARLEDEGPFTPGLAKSAELEGMYEEMTRLLIEVGFLKQANPDYWMFYLRRLFARTHLYSREVQIIRGICRQIKWYVEGRGGS